MSNYKKLDVNGKTIYYDHYYCGHPDVSELYTKFFTLEGKRTEMKWSWRKFRKVPTGNQIDNYVEIFEFFFDIEKPYRTKSEVRRKLEYNLELLGRAEEIKKGELI